MESSRRAVESYWRSRMVDAATSDEDKVAPVYKLEEICDLLRTSHTSVVKEVSEFVLKRLDHKSPIVKQKALRLIKYCVGKSGAEFRREMQRNSAAVRNLIHYKGQPDALKGDALNKAVRVTANETISAIFSEESKRVPARESGNRIQGFGNTNMELPSEDRKSFLSEVVGIGSATIMNGISNIAQAHNQRNNGNGIYKSQNLHLSFFTDSESSDSYEPVRLPNETQYSSGQSKVIAERTWHPDSRLTTEDSSYDDSNSSHKEMKTREEKLLETIVTSGGVRLQPTRDAIHIFLVEAAKLDALELSRAIDCKLQSPTWQVRLKALCVLESLLRKKEEGNFPIVFSFFDENRDHVVGCSESPQSSLREKANRVLNLLSGSVVKPGNIESSSTHVPDLIDTRYEDGLAQDDNPKKENSTTVTSLVDDLLGGSFDSGVSSSNGKNEDDPFLDVSFHAGGDADNLFMGMNVDEKSASSGDSSALKSNETELLDLFATKIEPSKDGNLNNMMNDLSIGGGTSSTLPISDNIFSDFGAPPLANNLQGSFLPGMAAAYGYPGVMLNPGFQTQPMSYDALGNFIAQQQYMAMQNMLNSNTHLVNASTANGGGYSSPLPDIFQPNKAPASIPSARKEDTRAFDFISDHVAAARDQKRIA